MAKTINSRIPEGPVAEKWTNYKAHQRLVNPKNKLKLDIIVVGTGLAGASAAASLGASRTLPVVLTLSQLRAVSTLPRTIRTTATQYTVCSTIQ